MAENGGAVFGTPSTRAQSACLAALTFFWRAKAPREPSPQAVAHVSSSAPSPPSPVLRGTYFSSTSSIPKNGLLSIYPAHHDSRYRPDCVTNHGLPSKSHI